MRQDQCSRGRPLVHDDGDGTSTAVINPGAGRVARRHIHARCLVAFLVARLAVFVASGSIRVRNQTAERRLRARRGPRRVILTACGLP